MHPDVATPGRKTFGWLMAQGEAPLDFLIAGVQKSGTTALWHYLRQHPAIALPDKKEVHFFDNDRLDWRTPPYRELHRKIASRPGTRVRGEATPAYIFWPGSLERIASYNPDIKLIVCLREPISRAYSHWRMQRQRGREGLEFSRAIREGRERLVAGTRDSETLKAFSYVERGLYASQLDRVCELFGRDRLLILKQSDLLGSARETLDHVCLFLGVEPFAFHPAPETVFSLGSDPRAEMDPTDVDYLMNFYADDMSRLRSVYGVAFD